MNGSSKTQPTYDSILSNVLTKDFYYRNSNNELSRALIGKYLIKLDPQPIGGMIVETESYPGGSDTPSHHSEGRLTDRTKVLLESEKGLAYVYKIYGLHFCLSITGGSKKGDDFVTLVRALEPKYGIETMRKRRNIEHIYNLTNGPAKLTEALNITKKDYGHDLRKPDLILCNLDEAEMEIGQAPRIGINSHGQKHTEKPWRFYLKGSKFVSTT